jgi:tRNA pseudouridine55 synthase
VVDAAQRAVRPAKVGHAGTLDPLASGVLVICVGAATRLIQYVQQMPKRYTATFLLGRRSPTEDIQGEVAPLQNAPVPAHEQILAAARTLVGRIQQRPPAFSALKIGGRRAYDLARQGLAPDLAPRPVTVYACEVLRYEYPELVLGVECGGGTYVRSLGRDLAESLGTAAVMSALVRTAIGPFRVEDAVDFAKLNAENLLRHLLPMLRAVETLPQMVLTSEELARIRNGLAVRRGDCPTSRVGENGTVPFGPAADSGEIAALDAAGRLVAILCPRGPGLWGPRCNLPNE